MKEIYAGQKKKTAEFPSRDAHMIYGTAAMVMGQFPVTTWT